MILLKLIQFSISGLQLITRLCPILFIFLLPRHFSHVEVIFMSPVILFGLWVINKILEFVKSQVWQLKNAFSSLYKLKSERLNLEDKSKKLDEKEKYLRDAEIFLAKQIDKYNHAKDNLMQEVHEYHQELVNDFILKHSKDGSNH